MDIYQLENSITELQKGPKSFEQQQKLMQTANSYAAAKLQLLNLINLFKMQTQRHASLIDPYIK